jgi:uncharacterized delta-60 repeat protein
MRTEVTVILTACYAAGVCAAGGDLDATFNPGTGASVTSGSPVIWTSALQPDGKLIIGGFFTGYNGTARNHIARVDKNGALDSAFNPGSGADGTVLATAVQPDGRVIVAGAFTHMNGVSRNYIARLEVNGALDPVFDPPLILPNGPPSQTYANVYATALQSNGNVLVGGPFGIARWNESDGSNDGPFNTLIGTGPNGTVYAIAVQTDGKIIIGGTFTSFNGTPAVRLARLLSTGTLDATFNPALGADATVEAIAVQPDGKIVIGGYFLNYNGTSRKGIARLLSNGSLDPTFNPGTGTDNSFGIPHVDAITVQPDGKIILGGAFTAFNGTGRAHIARANSDGTVDSTFDPAGGVQLFPANGLSPVVHTTALQPDGRIIIGGEFTDYNATSRKDIARLLPATGALSFSASDSAIGEAGGNAVITLTRSGGTDNPVIARITLADVTTSPADYVARAGALDPNFNAGPASNGFPNNPFAVAVQADGKILLGGFYFDYAATFRKGIVRLLPNGALDVDFDPGEGTAFAGPFGNAVVFAIALQPDGKILIGGDFGVYDGTPRSYVARLKANGSLDPDFDPGSVALQPVRTITVQPDGKIIIGGDYISLDGVNRTHIARLNPDGTPDPSFDPPLTFTPSIRTSALQPDGRIIIAGDFTNYAGTGRNFIARLHANGALDTSFSSGAGALGYVNSVVLQPDGKVIVAGDSFTRVNSDGSPDASFAPGAGSQGVVEMAALQPDGKIIIVGGFQSYNGVERELIARVHPSGALDLAFDPIDGTNTGIRVVALQPDGGIVIAGSFSNYNGVARRGVG